MYRFFLTLGVIMLAGCAAKPKGPPEDLLAKQLKPGCYTVDLFDPFDVIAPARDVPKNVSAFLGAWKDGAWDGRWCHELIVTKVFADGRVELLDLYGPLHDYGLQATVFRRKGTIIDGKLQVGTIGHSTATYERVGKYLVGRRTGRIGTYEITMAKDSRITELRIPIPVPRAGT